MAESKTLIYAFSENSSESRWMPWELGYFDGIKQKAAILPISKSSISNNSFHGNEYLEIYYYITKGLAQDQNEYLWVRENYKKYVRFDWWKDLDLEPELH